MSHAGGGTESLKQILAILLGAGVVIFAATNLEPVTVRVFFWQVEVSLALLILLPLLAGFLLGWVYGRWKGRRPEGEGGERAGRGESAGARRPGRSDDGPGGGSRPGGGDRP